MNAETYFKNCCTALQWAETELLVGSFLILKQKYESVLSRAFILLSETTWCVIYTMVKCVDFITLLLPGVLVYNFDLHL